MYLTNSKEDDNVKNFENPNEEIVKDYETLGLENHRTAENLGKLGLGCYDDIDVNIGAPTEAKSNSVLESLKENVLETDVAPDATTSAVQGNLEKIVIPESPDTANIPEKEKSPKTTKVDNVSGDNIVVISQSDESLKTVSEHSESAKKDKNADLNLIDVDNLNYGESQVEKTLAPIAKRLRSRSGKGVATRSKKTNTPSKGKKTSTPTKKPVNFGPPRSASKVNVSSAKEKKSSERKEPLSSDSEFKEEAVKVTTGGSSRKTVKGKKAQLNVCPTPLNNVSFHLEDGSSKWRFIFYRRLSLERNLSSDLLNYKVLIELIEAAGLVKTVKDLGSCYEKLVKEFFINIGEDCYDPENPEYRKVCVRGRCTEFSPAIVNDFLGRSTNGVHEMKVSNDEIFQTFTNNQVRKWPSKIFSAKLIAKYALLNKIGVANWVPTSHTLEVSIGMAKFIYVIGTRTAFDFGSYIFDQTYKHAKSLAVQMPIAFPTLICGIILSQHLDICIAADVPCAREANLSLNYRLFKGSHAADIVGPSGKKSSDTLSKQQMIADLKATSKDLEERKLYVDHVIQVFEVEVAKEGGLDDDGTVMQVEGSDESASI
ncbi:envelope-like protein [Trifolium pratense]|uniref:Envelope-like protein n=1 Tax=Trifolium pratense TaxID=57577 RepID=A0A2K3PDF4_TRIPR|nr:envelope-like protein [Trifolium pratense]